MLPPEETYYLSTKGPGLCCCWQHPHARRQVPKAQQQQTRFTFASTYRTSFTNHGTKIPEDNWVGHFSCSGHSRTIFTTNATDSGWNVPPDTHSSLNSGMSNSSTGMSSLVPNSRLPCLKNNVKFGTVLASHLCGPILTPQAQHHVEESSCPESSSNDIVLVYHPSWILYQGLPQGVAVEQLMFTWPLFLMSNII